MTHDVLCGQDGEGGCTCSVPTHYGRELSMRERAVRGSLLQMKHGETMNRRSGLRVSRALWGPWFYVTNQSGYHCESLGSTSTAVYIVGLESI